MFEIQRSGDKTSSGEIGLDIRTHASPKVGTGPGVTHKHQRSKRILVKVSNGCFPIELCVFVIFVNSARISAPFMQFVINVWMNCLCFETFSFHCIDYFTCIVPER